jgi:hypothetical protein
MTPRGHTRAFPSVIDSTMIAALACHRRWDYAYQRNYIPDSRKNIHLMAGAAFAKGLEVMRLSWSQGFYDRPVFKTILDEHGVESSVLDYNEHCVIESTDDALELGLEALMLAYDESVEHNTAKTLDRMCGALEYYASVFPIDDPEFGIIETIAGRPGIEWNFCAPLPVLHPDTGEPLLYSGRLDVVLAAYAGRYLTDDKTTSSLGYSWPNQWDMRGQFASYAWGASESGLQIDGTLVRGISILKTKYDHAQTIVHQPPWKQAEWLASTCEKLEYAKQLYARGINVAAFGEACNEYGGCEFKIVCMGKNHEEWMASNFDERNWNPLERH